MKKLLTLMLASTLVLSLLAGCKGKTETPETTAPAGANLDGSLTEILDSIYEIHKPQFDTQAMEVDITDADNLKWLTGLDSAEGVSEALVSEALIRSQAYSLLLVRCENAADAPAIAEKVYDGIDPAKWICVEADSRAVVTYGDIVLHIMVGGDLDEASSYTDAFHEVIGADFTFEK